MSIRFAAPPQTLGVRLSGTRARAAQRSAATAREAASTAHVSRDLLKTGEA